MIGAPGVCGRAAGGGGKSRHVGAGHRAVGGFQNAVLHRAQRGNPVAAVGVATDGFVVPHVHEQGEVHLLEVAPAIDFLRPAFRGGKGRQQHGGQDGDNGDHDQQFDQSKAGLAAAVGRHHKFGVTKA